MKTRGATKSYNEDSASFGQFKGPDLVLEVSSDQKIDDCNFINHPEKISWPYKSQMGTYYRQWVCDVEYTKTDGTYQVSLETMLTRDTSFFEPLQQHLIQADQSTKDMCTGLYESIDSWKTSSHHNMAAGDIVESHVNGEPKYFYIKTKHDLDLIIDFEFIICKSKDLELIEIDISMNDISNEAEFIQSPVSHKLSHVECVKIDLNVESNASLRVKFGHLKYYHATKEIKKLQEEKQIRELRLESVRSQTLQNIGKKYHRTLNGISTTEKEYSRSTFCGATAYMRCLVPFLTDVLGDGYDWIGNKKNISHNLSKHQLQSILGAWTEKTFQGDASKGESDVKYFGRRIRLSYSFITNMITLRYQVTKRRYPGTK